MLLKSRARNHGGLEKNAIRIATAFKERGAQVTILTSGKREDAPKIEGVSFYTTQTIPWPSFLRMEQFDAFVKKWVQKNPADLIFGMDRNRIQTHIRAGNGVHAAFLESRLHTEGRWKYYTCLCNPMHQKILKIEKNAFEYPGLKKLFTNSNMVRNQILERFSTPPEKIQVVHNGVEWKEMQADFEEWERKRAEGFEKVGLKRDRFQFLFIGNGYLRKGLDRLLQGLARLSFRDFELSVIGKDNHLDFYKAYAAQLGLQNQVHFFGVSQEIRLFYQMADVLVIPSFYDPFANVTVEALAMGLFVVSSKMNGGHEILTEKNGTVIEDLLDSDSMAKALELSLQHRKTPLSALSARKSVEYLDFSQQMKTLVDACE